MPERTVLLSDSPTDQSSKVRCRSESHTRGARSLFVAGLGHWLGYGESNIWSCDEQPPMAVGKQAGRVSWDFGPPVQTARSQQCFHSLAQAFSPYDSILHLSLCVACTSDSGIEPQRLLLLMTTFGAHSAAITLCEENTNAHRLPWLIQSKL